MKREYDEVLSEYGIAAYNENTSNDKPAMTEREKFESKIKAIDELFGITRNFKYDECTDNYFDAPTNSAYAWFKHGYEAATKAAVPEGWKLVPVDVTDEMQDGANRGFQLAKSQGCSIFDCIHDAVLGAIAAAPEVK